MFFSYIWIAMVFKRSLVIILLYKQEYHYSFRSWLESFWIAIEVLGWPSEALVCSVEGEEHVDDTTPNAQRAKPSFSEPWTNSKGIYNIILTLLLRCIG